MLLPGSGNFSGKLLRTSPIVLAVARGEARVVPRRLLSKTCPRRLAGLARRATSREGYAAAVHADTNIPKLVNWLPWSVDLRLADAQSCIQGFHTEVGVQSASRRIGEPPSRHFRTAIKRGLRVLLVNQSHQSKVQLTLTCGVVVPTRPAPLDSIGAK